MLNIFLILDFLIDWQMIFNFINVIIAIYQYAILNILLIISRIKIFYKLELRNPYSYVFIAKTQFAAVL